MKYKNQLCVPFEVKAEDIEDNGTFQGYGSLFDKTPDSYNDIVERGAFKKSLAQGGRNRNGVPMLWQHNSTQIPGIWLNLKEDPKGLLAQGKLLLQTTLGNDVYHVMKEGADAGTFSLNMSIGYSPKKHETDEETGIRTLKEVELWELSLVTFPAKLGASVSVVKSIEQAKNIREVETALRDSGFSKKEAQLLISTIKSSLRDSEMKANEPLSEILSSLKQVNSGLSMQHESSNLVDAIRSVSF